MTDPSWIYCCIHDVHPTLERCLEWEIMENVLNFDLKSLHIICNIWITLTEGRAFAMFTCTKHRALAAACGILSLMKGYESSQEGDKTLYPRILTEQTFISTALKAMQPSWLNKSAFWQKGLLFAPEFLLRWTPGLRITKLVEAATAFAHQMFLYHLQNHSRVSSVPLFPFVCMNSQLQGESKLQDISLLASPSEMS